MMNKIIYKFVVLLFGCLLQQNVNAISIEIGSGVSELVGIERVMEITDLSTGVIIDTAIITNWSLTYDDVTDSGSFTLTATPSRLPSLLQITGTSVFANANGSLRIQGEASTGGFSPVSFSGDAVVTVDNDFSDQLTLFTLSLLEVPNTSQKGFLVTGASVGLPFLEAAVDFEVASGLSSAVESPFPVFTPVPVPAAVWLLGSGLLGLFAVARNKRA